MVFPVKTEELILEVTEDSTPARCWGGAALSVVILERNLQVSWAHLNNGRVDTSAVFGKKVPKCPGLSVLPVLCRVGLSGLLAAAISFSELLNAVWILGV